MITHRGRYTLNLIPELLGAGGHAHPQSKGNGVSHLWNITNEIEALKTCIFQGFGVDYSSLNKNKLGPNPSHDEFYFNVKS